MVHIVVIGAGLGGLPTAYELRRLLPRHHQVTLLSNTPKFTFLPSLPWVGLGLTPLAHIQLDLAQWVPQRGINWIPEAVVKLDPYAQVIHTDRQALHYDHVVIATGAELAMDAVPGLGPDWGYTQSVCTPHHAVMARETWQAFLQDPGPLVVGAVPGTGCFGPAYEFAFMADYVLRKRGLRDQVSITFVTPEPYAGHMGMGGMAHARQLVTQLLAQREIEVLENRAIAQIHPHHLILAEGDSLPFRYAMLLPPFRGPRFVREVAGLGDAQGFIPVLSTYQHPIFPRIHGVGVVTQLAPPEPTPLSIGVPKTGQMTEAMAIAVAHNLAVELGVRSAPRVAPTLEAICFADFGGTGLLFWADPVLPDPVTGQRRRAIAWQGAWVSWLKTAFEHFFLAKMRWGMAVPWFERLVLQGMGVSLVEPLPALDSQQSHQDALNL